MDPGRRRFVQGLAAGAVVTALDVWRWPRRAGAAAAEQQTLTGNHFELVVDRVPANITGRRMTATAFNGSVPGPILRWREGDTVVISVTNRLPETTSIHWHGILLPADMDGVPGLSFAGIAANSTFVYRFPVAQSGTYWYHSHSGFQEQMGLYGPLIIDPLGKDPIAYDRDYVVMLSDWTDENPETILSNLKEESSYYNFHQRTVGTFFSDVRKNGLRATLADRWMWGRMNMSPTDILDVSGATYTYLLNGQPPAANWTGAFHPGERIRLRLINSSAMTIFDVRIPNLPMTVVQADGNNVEPVTVDELRISVAETYDVIVQPPDASAYTLFAQTEDRTGYARGTLAPKRGMAAAVPPMDPRPLRTMVDMGMAHAMAGMQNGPGMQHEPGMHMEHSSETPPPLPTSRPAGLRLGPTVDGIAEAPTERLSSAGDGFPPGRRVLAYTDLRARQRGTDPRPPGREIELHLTGNMERFIWGFDGKKFSDAEPIRLALGERVRVVLVNDTMMEHPLHLHGMWSELDNGHGDFRPYKHTINVKPGERLAFLASPDTPGHWAMHCHLSFHMDTGMFRTVIVS